MTDDRAQRIRNLRKKRRGPDPSEEESSAADEADSETASTDDDISDPSTDSDTGEESQDSNHDPSAGGSPESEPSPTQSQSAGTAQQEQPATTNGTGQQEQPATTDGQIQQGQLTGTHDQPLQHAPNAQPTDSNVAAGGASQGLQPMVDATAETHNNPFGGAIADESVMAEFVDDIGDEGNLSGTSGLGDASGGSMGRDGVFERGDSIVASAHDSEETIQMLEFYLNENRYAIEIERISAIVEMKQITRFPRGPEAIDGVTDLRGEITAVLDPTTLLEVDQKELTDDQYIVVLERDDDKQKLGIRVTDVLQAVTYRESQIDETAALMDSAGEEQHEFLNGIIKKTTDGKTKLVNWLDIDAIIEHTK